MSAHLRHASADDERAARKASARARCVAEVRHRRAEAVALRRRPAAETRDTLMRSLDPHGEGLWTVEEVEALQEEMRREAEEAAAALFEREERLRRAEALERGGQHENDARVAAVGVPCPVCRLAAGRLVVSGDGAAVGCARCGARAALPRPMSLEAVAAGLAGVFEAHARSGCARAPRFGVAGVVLVAACEACGARGPVFT